MDGPSHYRRAEEILIDIGEHSYSGELEVSLGLQALTHATLANAAATATGSSGEWMRTAGTRLDSGS